MDFPIFTTRLVLFRCASDNPFTPRSLLPAKMQLYVCALLFLFQSIATATPLVPENGEHQIRHLSSGHSPRNVQYGGLVELEKRVTTIPDLVPTTTVNLGTDSTASTQIVSPNRAGQTSSTTSTTTNAFAVPTGHSTSSMTATDSSVTQVMGGHRATVTSSAVTAPASSGSNGSPAAKSTSSKGGASNSNTIPLAGILLLGLLGL